MVTFEESSVSGNPAAISAEQELVLPCGQASITLTKAGNTLIVPPASTASKGSVQAD
jgi:hypothetical protein